MFSASVGPIRMMDRQKPGTYYPWPLSEKTGRPCNVLVENKYPGPLVHSWAEFIWLWVVAAANVTIFGNISSCYQSNSGNGNISSC